MRSSATFLSASLVLMVLCAPVVSADSWFDKVKKKVEQKSTQRVDQKTDQAIDKGLDSAENAIKCAATDQACIEKAQQEGKKVVLTDEAGNPLPADQQPAAAPAAAAKGEKSGPAEPMQGVWANFDFVPGNRVIFYEDFMQDNVGDFPRRWGFEAGIYEIVEWQGTRFLRGQNDSGAWIAINLAEVLPERWTFEMDYIFGHPVDETGGAGIEICFEKEHADYKANCLELRPEYASLRRGGEGTPEAGTKLTNVNDNRPNRLSLLADGAYIKLYINDKRIANVPNAVLDRSDKIWFNTFHSNEAYPVYVGAIRVAASDKKIYDTLLANGRVAMQGIYFDTGSDKLRPESTGTLKQIGQMLKEHPDLRVMIEGHTDNVGGEASNQALSDKRAAAVKQFLAASFGIDAGRLESKGFGASKPAAPNDTPEGRQTNRRVELVKL